MIMKRVVVMVFMPLLLAAFLQSQSLVELAKKEKERREALKGTSTTVVTNAVLAQVKKKPSIESAETELAEGEAQAQTGQEAAPPPEKAEAADEAEAGAGGQVVPAEPAAPSEKEIETKRNELIDLAAQKQEMVDLLTLKMNALYQEFYSLDNQKSKEILQIQISDTYDKLLKAEADAVKARKDVEEFIAASKKDSIPTIWIK